MKKFLAVTLLGIIGVIIGYRDVQALENDSRVTIEYPGTIYGYHYKAGVLRSNGRVPFRYQNGVLSYCIEPYVGIHSDIYNSTTDWSITGYSEDVKRQMELIAYYGYEYPGHNTLNYYLATQELIWLFNDDSVKFMDEYSDYGDTGNQIIVENEKMEIMRLVNNHNKIPSFGNMWYSKKYGEIMNLSDSNGVFNNFEVNSTTKYKKDGNNLKIYLNTFGMQILNFTKKVNNNRTTTVYYYNGYSQTMASFGINEEIKADMHINVNSVRIRINKRDSNTKNLIENNEAIFNIKNTSTGVYVKENIKTNEKGYIQLELPPGEYEIYEIDSPNGYVLPKEKIIVNLNNDIRLLNSEYQVDIYNEEPKGKIVVNKTDEEDNPLNGIEIGLFDKEHNKISSIITGENNSFEDLNLGTYYIKELNTLSGYKLDDKEYIVNLEYVDDNTYVVSKEIKIINEKIKCDITYISSEKLKGIKINVFDEQGNIVFDGITDDDGQVIINNLPYGKYIIKQIKVPSGYKLNEDEYIFYVNDSTCIGKINVHNEETVMPITSTSINKCLSVALILMGLGIFNYVKKNN